MGGEFYLHPIMLDSRTESDMMEYWKCLHTLYRNREVFNDDGIVALWARSLDEAEETNIFATIFSRESGITIPWDPLWFEGSIFRNMRRADRKLISLGLSIADLLVNNTNFFEENIDHSVFYDPMTIRFTKEETFDNKATTFSPEIIWNT